MDLKEIGCSEVDWIELAQDRDRVTVDMTAYQSLAVVFSQRCLESGITEVYCNMEAKPGSKVASFLSGVEQGGLVLSEPARFRPQGPRSLHKPEKPWEVIE
uniref:Uncharacterized protein n=1 Tax=Timema poppense TaxID=170557 RepID=A0A7R9HBC8_TIMPO|nr:unnamed protein product [Timema poppensis]